MDIQQLKNFVTTAEYEHLSHAAEELNLSQSSLSYSINQLESELGVPLFDRIGRNIKINKAGLIFKQYATEIIRLSEEAAADINEQCGQGTHHVVMQSIPLSHYDRLFDQLYAVEHGLEIIPVAADTPVTLAENLLNKKTDLCFSPFELPESGLEHVSLCEDTIVALVSEIHPLYKESSITADQLREQQFISGGTAISSIFLDSLAKALKFTPDIPFRCATHEEGLYLLRKTPSIYLIGENVFGHMKNTFDLSDIHVLQLDPTLNTFHRNLYWRRKNNPASVIKLRETLVQYFDQNE